MVGMFPVTILWRSAAVGHVVKVEMVFREMVDDNVQLTTKINSLTLP